MASRFTIISRELSATARKPISSWGLDGYCEVMGTAPNYRNRRAQVLHSAAVLSDCWRQTGEAEYGRWIGHKIEQARRLRAFEYGIRSMPDRRER